MTRFDRDTRVDVHPFSRQVDGDDIIIGRPDTGTFLALPPEAVEILDMLGEGKTVGEASDGHQQRYGEVPDLEDFLGLLESKGLVAVAGVDSGSQGPATPPPVRFHFTGFPRPLARVLFGPIGLTVATLAILLGGLVAFSTPALVPRWDALYFEHSRTAKSLTVVFLSYITLFIHEMGHMVAARAAGVDSRLGISHRLWILVAETDLTGVWSIPKRRRYLPLLGGPLVDAVQSSIILVLLLANDRGWIALPHVAWQLVRALFLVYMIQILWQFLFFVRTDFYYVFANFFSCRNLMKDTEDFLKNLFAPWWSRFQKTDQSGIPRAERRVVRAYAVFWLGGRLVAFGGLAFISLPLFWRYIVGVSRTLSAGFSAHPYSFLDSLVLSLISIVPFSIGVILWLRSLTKKWRTA